MDTTGLVNAIEERLSLSSETNQIKEELEELLGKVAYFPVEVETQEGVYTLYCNGDLKFTTTWCWQQGRCECQEGEGCQMGQDAEKFLALLINYLLGQVAALRTQITQRNNLARALRLALANKTT